MKKPVMITAEIPGPFDIYIESYKIKADNRKPAVAGEQIVPAGVQVSSGSETAGITLINGSGVRDIDGDRLLEHNISTENMWLTDKGKTTGEVIIDLGDNYALELIKVWNYNGKWLTKRGVKKADISAWTEEGLWQKVFDDFSFDQASGYEDYDEPVLVRLDNVKARKIRFDDLSNYGDADYIGLSEIQFFKQRGPQAVIPQPADKANAGTEVAISWIPGRDAVKHKVYFGYDANDMKLLGTVKGEDNSSAKLTELGINTKCYWRIDEVDSKGKVTEGSIWSFSTGKLKGWWKFNEPDGTTAKDSASGFDGSCQGGVSWKPSEGKVSGALEFNGDDGFVDLPDSAGQGGGGFSVCLWAYPTEATYWGRFIEFGNGESSDNILFTREDTTNNLIFEVWGVSEDGAGVRGRLSASNAIELNKWQFFAATVDNQGNAVIYKDGKTIQNGTVFVPRDVNREQNYIGKSNWSADRNFKGMMDDVRIYSYALSEDEVNTIYSGGELKAAGSLELPKLVAAESDTAQDGKGKNNLAAVLIIILIVVVIAVLVSRKKKTA